MARPKKPRANPQTDAYVGVIGLSANQIVAYNLARARQWKRWTQDQAAKAIEPYLGVRWSKASVSQAERSVDGGFVRNFSADEIVAFAQGFELPITWFFMPPPPEVIGGTVVLVGRDRTAEQPLARLVDLIFGTEADQALLTLRLDDFLAHCSTETRTQAQARVASLVKRRVEALLRDSFRHFDRLQTQLRGIANHLEDLEKAAKRDVAREADVNPGELRLHDSETSAPEERP
jgi:hypothetical protein